MKFTETELRDIASFLETAAVYFLTLAAQCDTHNEPSIATQFRNQSRRSRTLSQKITEEIG